MKGLTFSKFAFISLSCNFTKSELFHRYSFAKFNGYFYLYFKI